MVITNTYTNENHKVGTTCAWCVNMESSVETQVENEMNKLIDLRGNNIDMYYWDVFVPTFTGLCEK